MTNTYKNLCSRCGKERVLFKTYQEDMVYSKVTTTEMICPDESCQQKVNSDNKRREEKHAEIKMKHAQRIRDRKAAMDAARVDAEA